MEDWEPWSPIQQQIMHALVSGANSADRSRRQFFISVITQLRLLIPCDEVAVVVLDQQAQCVTDAIGAPRTIRVPQESSFHAAFWHDCWKPAEPSASLQSEPRPQLYLPAQIRRVTLHGVLGADLTNVVALFVTVLASATESIRLILFRRNGTFLESERLVLNLLTPYLLARFRYVVAWEAQTRLTTRQRAVISLAARGYSGHEIAQELQLAPGTVRKHFDNIYARLGVSNRTVAVMQSFPYGMPLL